jgi:hypothetical protein
MRGDSAGPRVQPYLNDAGISLGAIERSDCGVTAWYGSARNEATCFVAFGVGELKRIWVDTPAK